MLEPQPLAAQALRTSFPGVQVFELALADFEGESTFQYVVTNPGYSGLRLRDYPRPDETIETLRVRVDRLDRLIPDEQRIDFIKIDVEGYELEVLAGLATPVRALSFEYLPATREVALDCVERLAAVPGFKKTLQQSAEKLAPDLLSTPARDSLLVSVAEFVLEGLHVHNKLNKSEKSGKTLYRR